MTDTPLIDAPPEGPTPPPRGLGEPRGEIAGGAWRLALLAAAVVALGVFAGKGWLFIVAALTVMIFLHELGHFLTAKWTGMKVTEFFLGFGPKLWSFRRGETEYGIKLIPVLAYVRIIGMNNLDEVDPEDEPRTYRQQTFPRRMLVITAGSMMHFIQAFVLFLVVFTIVGVPRDSVLADDVHAPPINGSVSNLLKGGAAEAAGIRPGDVIVRIDGHDVKALDDVAPLIKKRPGASVTIVVDRKGHDLALPVTIGHIADEPKVGQLGVEMTPDKLPGITTSPLHGVVLAGRDTGTWIGQTVQGLGSFVTGGLGHFADSVVQGGRKDSQAAVVSSANGGSNTGAAPQQDNRIVSIYGVARLGAQFSENSTAYFLMLLAFVNISIGVLNLVPLLPLDGGHAAIAIYERIRSIRGRRHMTDVSRLLPLTYAVVLVLSVVMVSSLYLDIVDPVSLR